MRFRAAAVAALLLNSGLAAQGSPTRRVERNTLTSPADPAASLTFDQAFRYVGGQVVDVVKVAIGEQHFFMEVGPDQQVRRFYWVQFEQYKPDNAFTYDFSGMQQTPVALGRLTFGGDVRVRPNYFSMDQRPGSDSKAAEEFLKSKGLKLGGSFATLRLFHLPDTTRRRELMIIYGELVPAGTAEQGVAAGIIARAQAGVTVR